MPGVTTSVSAMPDAAASIFDAGGTSAALGILKVDRAGYGRVE